MKKLIFLSLILLNLSNFCIFEQTESQAELVNNRQKRLKKAVKKRNLRTIIELIKNIKQTNSSSAIFNDPKLLEIASKKFKNKKTCMNDSSSLEELLYVLVPACFIAPYAFYYFLHRNGPTILLDIEAARTISVCSTFFPLIGCFACHLHKKTACKESKLIYKILREYSSQNQSRVRHA